LVRHISCDEKGDFFLIMCREYDKQLYMTHSGSDTFRLEFDFEVEPGVLQVFDFNTQVHK